MRLTSFTDYSLRVLIYLGVHAGESRLSTISEIAAAYDISENHLMKIVHQLAKLGYVDTLRGKGGGMRLARQPREIIIGEVVRRTEDELAMFECCQQGGRRCPIGPVCELRGILGRALGAFMEILDGHTLEDLLRPTEQLARLLKPAVPPM